MQVKNDMRARICVELGIAEMHGQLLKYRGGYLEIEDTAYQISNLGWGIHTT